MGAMMMMMMIIIMRMMGMVVKTKVIFVGIGGKEIEGFQNSSRRWG